MGARLPLTLLTQVEGLFISTYAQAGTEERALIYADEAGNLMLVRPPMVRSTALVEGNVPLSFEWDGSLWDLAFDLHSHHIMGCTWSRIDDANERIRGPVFGVCSWRHGAMQWLFRRFNGESFEGLTLEDVVADG